MRPDFGALIQNIEFKAVGTINSSTTSAAVDLKEYEGDLVLVLDAENTTGTLPTLAIKVTECDTSGGIYSDVASGAFTGLTTTASAQKLVLKSNGLKRFVKLDWTIGGTDSPAYKVSVRGLAFKKILG